MQCEKYVANVKNRVSWSIFKNPRVVTTKNGAIKHSKLTPKF